VVWFATHRVTVLNSPSVWLGTIEKLGAVWVAIALGTVLWRTRRVWNAVTVALATAATTFAADAVSFLIKDLTSRRRPFEVYPKIHPLYVVHSSSFPAGHAATAFAGATLLGLLFPRLAPLLLVLASMIGFSRIYDGVHYPSDVLAGAAVGALIGAAAAIALTHGAAHSHALRQLVRL